MDKSILQKYTRQDGELSGSNVVDLELVDDLGPFGWQRGLRDRCLMLELRRKSGNVLLLGYAWLHRIEFDPSEGITLWFGGQRVMLRGRNLGAELRPNVSLLDGLARHRVPWIQESGQADAMEATPDACIIESIDWEKAR